MLACFSIQLGVFLKSKVLIFGLSMVIMMFFLSGCIPDTEVSLSEYPYIHSNGAKNIDPACKIYYTKGNIKVAVLPENKRREGDRLVSSQLEEVLTNLGGVDVYSRSDMKKITNEIKLQNSGLVNDNSAVQVGELAGVRYIVVVKTLNVVVSKKSDMTNAMIKGAIIGGIAAGLGADAGAATGIGVAGGMITAGTIYTYTSHVNFKVLDVATSKVLYSKVLVGEYSFRGGRNVSRRKKISATKQAYLSAVTSSKAELYKYFKLYGYVLQSRTDKDKKQVVMTNLGYDKGVKEGDIFNILSVNVVLNPVTNKYFCSLTPTGIKVIVTNQLSGKYSWMAVYGKNSKMVLQPETLLGR